MEKDAAQYVGMYVCVYIYIYIYTYTSRQIMEKDAAQYVSLEINGTLFESFPREFHS